MRSTTASTMLSTLAAALAVPGICCYAYAGPPFLETLAGNVAIVRETSMVHSLNLVNRLFLSRQQMERLVALLEERRALEQRIAGIVASRRDEALADLARLRSVLEADQIPDEALTRRIRQVEGEIVPEMQRTQMAMEDHAARARDLLTANQRDLIAAYDPCLIPQEDKVSPGRIGAAEAPTEIVEGLSKLRAAPWVVYALLKSHLAGKAVADLKAKAPRLDEVAARRMVEEFFDRVRGMDESDWTSSKEEVVKGQIERLMTMAGLGHPRGDVSGKVAQHLLNCGLIPVLRARLTAQATATRAVDLGRLAGHGSCEKSRCGVRDGQRGDP